ncbi:MAG: YqgE/AlgH family protein [bacterium]
MNLKNHFLIAMPSMSDPEFDHTVTLLCQQDQEMGSFGITINRPMNITLDDLFTQLDIPLENDALKKINAVVGGPVQPEQGFIIHTTDKQWESTLAISDQLAVTSSRDILEDIALNKGPERFIFALGCAGWAPGQLEDEMKENTWLTVPVDQRILFDTPFSQRWKGAAHNLGIDINLISDTVGHA